MDRTECFYKIDRLLTERRGVTMAVLIEADGSYLLELPCSAAHELVMDILRHGPEVEVRSPARAHAGARTACGRAPALCGVKFSEPAFLTRTGLVLVVRSVFCLSAA
jgi:hypothetical protein